MKRYNFNEIYYASSERSVSSGYPGFGVRAYSEGLNASIIDVILNNGIGFVWLAQKRTATVRFEFCIGYFMPKNRI